jgi:hypothetical protein
MRRIEVNLAPVRLVGEFDRRMGANALQGRMRESDEKAAMLREALGFLPECNIPAQYKRLIIDAVETAARAAEASGMPQVRPDASEWQPHEVQLVQEFLAGKVAANWQHADERLMHLAVTLRRTPDDIKRKASELGLGVGVDYWQAKAKN